LPKRYQSFVFSAGEGHPDFLDSPFSGECLISSLVYHRSGAMTSRLKVPSGLLAGLLLLTASADAADEPVLLVVPPGTAVSAVQKARAAVPTSRATVLVGTAARIPLAGGLALQAEKTFADAPPSDLVVVLPGEAPGLDEFLAARKATASAILFAGESPVASRLPAGGRALVLTGGLDAIAGLAGGSVGAAAPADQPTPAPPATATLAATPASSGTFGRYFASSTPTPVPKPKKD
jgi:hypothetical protein